MSAAGWDLKSCARSWMNACKLRKRGGLESASASAKLDGKLQKSRAATTCGRADWSGIFLNNRLDFQALKERLLAEIAWNKVLARRIAPRIEIGADEVEARLAERRAAVGSREYVVSEIFLALNDPAREGEVRAAADGIVEQLRAGASFSGLARQFSQSSSAAIGGDLGRVRAGQLDSRLEAALDSLTPKNASAPIRLENGFYILLLRERSVVESVSAEGAEERAEIERRLRVERVNRRADRHLQDLRRTALVFRRR